MEKLVLRMMNWISDKTYSITFPFIFIPIGMVLLSIVMGFILYFIIWAILIWTI